MKSSFSLSMAWLHSWAGLVFGWILFAVFLTGSLTLFAPEITRWSVPEAPFTLQPDRARTVELASAYLQAHAPDADYWRVNLPRPRQRLLSVEWPKEKGSEVHYLNPFTGAEVMRATDGGRFFLRFHFTLGIKRDTNPVGFLLVGAAAIVMLVACLTGIVIHRRLFKDLFTFRPRSSAQRSWLDAHNLLSVLPLPFHLMIAYTGLVIIYWQYMPAAVDALYPKGESEYRADLLQQSYHKPRGEAAAGAARMSALGPLLDVAEQQLGRGDVIYFFIRQPNRADAVAEFFRRRDDRVRQQSDRVVVDAIDGRQILRVFDRDRTTAFEIQSFTAAMHIADFASPLVRWLYFLSGLAGAGAIAAGLVLFVQKRARRPDHLFAPAVLRLIRTLNLATIVGLPIASAVYMSSQRLLPALLSGRPYWSATAFFAAWLASLIFACFLPSRRGWIIQLGVTGLLCAGIPALAFFTAPGVTLVNSVVARDWMCAGIDLACLGFGAAFILGAWYLGAASHDRSRPGAEMARC